MLQESINERLNFIVNHYEKGRKAAFARKVGISPQGAQELLAGRKGDPSFKVLVKIIENYPQVRIEWLVLGSGLFFTQKDFEENVERQGKERDMQRDDSELYATRKEIDDAADSQQWHNELAGATIETLLIMLQKAESNVLRAQVSLGKTSEAVLRIRAKIQELGHKLV